MKEAHPNLLLRGGPFLHARGSSRGLMFEVLASLIPVVIAASWVFGALVVLLSCLAAVSGSVLAEVLLRSPNQKNNSLRDGSGVLTGLLLALTLPPSCPLWMVCLGGFVASAAGKMIFGGLGQNPFNPALVGRAFLQAAFPTTITRWTPPHTSLEDLLPATMALPFASTSLPDAVTGATALGLAKFEHQTSALKPLLWGNVAGSLGETSTLVLLGVAAWLSLRRVFDVRLFVGTIVAAGLTSALLHALMPNACPPPLFMLCSGGLLFGATFMVTDPVTSPVTPLGAWIFAGGVGALVVLIRVFGGLPEGVMYAILLMNSVSPLIERVTQPKPFGANVHP